MPIATEKQKWSRIKFVAFGVFLMPWSGAIGGAVSYAVWYLIVGTYFVSSMLLGANVDGAALQGSSQDWFLYIGAALGIAVGWLWLWVDDSGS